MFGATVFGYRETGFGLGAAPSPVSVIPAGWVEVPGRVTVVAEGSTEYKDTESPAEYQRVRAPGPGGQMLYQPPTGATVIFIQKGGTIWRIFIEPDGTVKRNWEILGLPLDVRSHKGSARADTKIEIKHEREVVQAGMSAGLWLLPIAAGLWYLWSGRRTRTTHRRARYRRIRLHARRRRRPRRLRYT